MHLSVCGWLMACRIGALLVNSDSYWFPRLQIAGNRGGIYWSPRSVWRRRGIIIIMSLLSVVGGPVTWYYNDSVIKIIFWGSQKHIWLHHICSVNANMNRYNIQHMALILNILYYLLFMQEWEFAGETGIEKSLRHICHIEIYNK